jgi:ribonuclease D
MDSTLEWKLQKKVGLLQIASHKGNVALISLGSGQKVPPEITSILADKKIVKAGIETFQDAQKLDQDYSINVNGTYDLRYLAEAAGYKPDSIAKLSKKFLDKNLERDFGLISADWDGPYYTNEQIVYAKTSAQASVDLFMKLSLAVSLKRDGNIFNKFRENLDKPFVYYSQKYDIHQIKF